MIGENIGTDKYGRTMRLYYIGNIVYCDHIKNGCVVRTSQQQVDNSVISMFCASHTSGAYIYDEIKRIYGKSL